MGRGVILLAAGGTGGHVFPAEALAHELTRRGWEIHLATDERANRYAGKFPATAIHPIASATLGSRNPLALARAFWKIWTGVRQASALIGRLQPKAVVGFGGYPTLPPLYAATRRGVPTMIHEQNAVMGRANRALARRVDAVAGGFLSEDTSNVPEKTVVTGNPVRPAVLEAAKITYIAPQAGEPFRLVVFGGSQGAQFFSEAIPPAIAALPDAERSRLRVSQQARAEDKASVRAAYDEIGVQADVSPFFTDMAERIGQAHLVMSRSGASTVAEVAAIGRPALFVPYPHALDHDQAANAAALARAGGAQVYQQSTLSCEKHTALFAGLMADPDRLAAMAAASKASGMPDAAVLLADLAEAIASGMTVSDFRKGGRA